jgi:DNA-binding transcriptional regulator YdaS (Cro superfamily)
MGQLIMYGFCDPLSKELDHEQKLGKSTHSVTILALSPTNVNQSNQGTVCPISPYTPR